MGGRRHHHHCPRRPPLSPFGASRPGPQPLLVLLLAAASSQRRSRQRDDCTLRLRQVRTALRQLPQGFSASALEPRSADRSFKKEKEATAQRRDLPRTELPGGSLHAQQRWPRWLRHTETRGQSPALCARGKTRSPVLRGSHLRHPRVTGEKQSAIPCTPPAYTGRPRTPECLAAVAGAPLEHDPGLKVEDAGAGHSREAPGRAQRPGSCRRLGPWWASWREGRSLLERRGRGDPLTKGTCAQFPELLPCLLLKMNQANLSPTPNTSYGARRHPPGPSYRASP